MKWMARRVDEALVESKVSNSRRYQCGIVYWFSPDHMSKDMKTRWNWRLENWSVEYGLEKSRMLFENNQKVGKLKLRHERIDEERWSSSAREPISLLSLDSLLSWWWILSLRDDEMESKVRWVGWVFEDEGRLEDWKRNCLSTYLPTLGRTWINCSFQDALSACLGTLAEEIGPTTASKY